MDIQCSSPPPRRVYVGRYSDLFAALAAAPGEWLSIPADAVTGKTQSRKQIRLHEAARYRRLRINTAFRTGKLYVRLRTETTRPQA